MKKTIPGALLFCSVFTGCTRPGHPAYFCKCNDTGKSHAFLGYTSNMPKNKADSICANYNQRIPRDSCYVEIQVMVAN